MKRKTTLLFLAMAVSLLVSCSYVQPDRTVSFRIPGHPWESASGKKLWYTLRWTDGQSVSSIHLSQDERSVTLEVSPGRTVLAVAYPLGDMSPFGAAITPEDSNANALMTQEDGVIVNMLIDMDSQVLGMLDYGLIQEQMRKKADDLRRIEDVSLVRDIQNGELSESSFKIAPCFNVQSFALSNGIWESEFLRDPSIVATEGMGSPISLPAGVYRFLNVEDEMVLVLIVDRDGAFYSYQKSFEI